MLSGFRKGLSKGLIKQVLKYRTADPKKHHLLQNQITNALALVIEKEACVQVELT